MKVSSAAAGKAVEVAWDCEHPDVKATYPRACQECFGQALDGFARDAWALAVQKVESYIQSIQQAPRVGGALQVAALERMRDEFRALSMDAP